MGKIEISLNDIDKCYHTCYNIFSMDQLGKRVKYCRVNKGWSQEKLARNIGVSLNTVQRWESGKTSPSPLAVVKLNEVLGDVLESDQLRLV